MCRALQTCVHEGVPEGMCRALQTCVHEGVPVAASQCHGVGSVCVYKSFTTASFNWSCFQCCVC